MKDKDVLPARVVVLDDVDAGFFFSSSLSGLRNDGGGGGGAGGAGGGLSFCSATSSLFTKSTSEINAINVLPRGV